MQEPGELILKINNQKFNFKGIIFDFDGVIMNTEKYHYMAWNKALQEYNIDLSYDEYKPLMSMGRAKTIENILKLKKIDLKKSEIDSICRLKGIFYDEFKNNFNESDFILGIKDFLNYLYDKKIMMCVASSSVATIELIKKFNLEKYFKEIIDGNYNALKKPNPDIFLIAENKMNLKNYECLIFEDSNVGIEASKNASINVIGIGGIKNDYAILCIDNFKQIKEYIGDNND